MLRVAFLYRNDSLMRSLTVLLDKCKSVSNIKQIHALLLTLGLYNADPFASKVLSFLALSDSSNVDYSFLFLSHLCNPTIFDWNTVVRGYSKSRNPNRSISVFVQMLRDGFSPDHLTYPFLLKASARLLKRELGDSVHTHIVKYGFHCDRFVQNSLIHMYAAFGDIRFARKMFDDMLTRNLVSWNAMLDGYAKCKDMGSARKLFDLMLERNVVSWSSLIDGYVKAGEYMEALVQFQKMQVMGTKANEVTMVSVLCACAHLGGLEQGRKMHHYLVENRLPLTIQLRTSLVDMYAKCGAIGEALGVFRGGLMQHTDVLIWNAMIGGLATHGFIKESLDLFEEMQINRIVPDEITYLCLLSACSHGGFVKEAWYFFNCLDKHGTTPKSEHYACVVDVLARAGQVEEAFKFICQMPMEPTASMLGALLSGCMNHGKLELAEIVGRKLIQIEPDHDGRYIGLSNVFAISKRWGDARSTREAMEKRGVKKSPGFSVVEISGALHRFVAHDEAHPLSDEIYDILCFIINQMKLDPDYEKHYCVYDAEAL